MLAIAALEAGQNPATVMDKLLAENQSSHWRAAAKVYWEISERTGLELAANLRKLQAEVVKRRQLEALTASRLAGPALSAKILAALPLLGILAAHLVGIEILPELIKGIGPYLLTLGGSLMLLGWGWTRALIRSTREALGQKDYGPYYLSDLCQLTASALQAGLPIPSALKILGQHTEIPELYRYAKDFLEPEAAKTAERLPGSRILKRLGFGKDPPDRLQELKQALEPSWLSGQKADGALVALQNSSEQQRQEAAEVLIEKLSVKITLPLGLCYLPAFMLLGVAPAVIALFKG
ncbi:hypothetical protein BSR29_00665 [Boudabousia liubingyangii]|uniref:Type II secretion system protein GspF domain-containing protein n=1 Tax=Boudabousia liubingyangii TaxID=1921764 RepID=A0A1Q5PPN8_9ACTO|nr:hypothetical protein BSR29_00665 [Boudabousia liubingyangii]